MLLGVLLVAGCHRSRPLGVAGGSILPTGGAGGAVDIDAPHIPANGVYCTSCHDADNWSNRGGSARCKTCHQLDGHGVGPAADVHLAKGGAVLAECVDCHNPHYQEQIRHWGASTSTSRYVRFEVRGREVKLLQLTGTNSLADGDSVYDGACEVCHTQTRFHRNDASGTHTHMLSRRCTSCHLHKDGFRALSVSCGDCHAVPPAEGSHAVHFGGSLADAAYGDTRRTEEFAAASTSSAYLFGCGTCHPIDPAFHMDDQLQVDLSPTGAPTSSLKFKNDPDAHYTPGAVTQLDADGLPFSNGTCSGVYCHSTTRYPNFAGGDPVPTKEYAAPVWGEPKGGPVTCGGCHGYPPREDTATANTKGKGQSHSWIIWQQKPTWPWGPSTPDPGVVTVQRGSTTVLGTQTSFTTTISVGAFFRVERPGAPWTRVLSVLDDRSFELTSPWLGGDATGTLGVWTPTTTPLLGLSSFTPGLREVSGSGAAYRSELVAGSWIFAPSDGVLYRVRRILSENVLLLAEPYQGMATTSPATRIGGPWDEEYGHNRGGHIYRADPASLSLPRTERWLDSKNLTDFQCHRCHRATVATSTPEYELRGDVGVVEFFADVPIVDRTRHVNGQADVVFNPAPFLKGGTDPANYREVDLSMAVWSKPDCTTVGCHATESWGHYEQTPVTWGTELAGWGSCRCHPY